MYLSPHLCPSGENMKGKNKHHEAWQIKSQTLGTSGLCSLLISELVHLFSTDYWVLESTEDSAENRTNNSCSRCFWVSPYLSPWRHFHANSNWLVVTSKGLFGLNANAAQKWGINTPGGNPQLAGEESQWINSPAACPSCGHHRRLLAHLSEVLQESGSCCLQQPW